MCYFYSLGKDGKALSNRYRAEYFEAGLRKDGKPFKPQYLVNGFARPFMPVIADNNTGMIREFRWGLIPSWVKSVEDAEKISLQTLNARCETVFEKPSFRKSVHSQRCLVPADGFYEWMHRDGKKYPFFIFLKSRKIFSLAGIWEEWKNRSTGELLRTFSILTTSANHLLKKIHNTKKRMPVILDEEKEKTWLDGSLKKRDIESLMVPYIYEFMDAYTVSRKLSSPGVIVHDPAITEPCSYPEL